MISIAASKNATSAGDHINFLRIVANINGCNRGGAVFFKPKEAIITDAHKVEVRLIGLKTLRGHFPGAERLIAFLEKLLNRLTVSVCSVNPSCLIRLA